VNPSWYWHRICKMTCGEVMKRFREMFITKLWFRQYGNNNITYRSLGKNVKIKNFDLPSAKIDQDWKYYKIYSNCIDLTQSIDWFMAEDGRRWPATFFSRINYRPGNPYGDIRKNWELNRLQFLPLIASSDAELTKRILVDWIKRNRFLHGPSYLSAMEVSLRWLSVYRAVCQIYDQADDDLLEGLSGLGVASGNYIENHLSTYSSAGNHLIIEALGLFWLGKALPDYRKSTRWVNLARHILWHQALRQLNPDGTNREQTFWYLGYVMDAYLHYILLEDKDFVPGDVYARLKSAFCFINDMVLTNGLYPDYGDRDDGYVFRLYGDYSEPYFLQLLETASFFFQESKWKKNSGKKSRRAAFYICEHELTEPSVGDDADKIKKKMEKSCYPTIKTYHDGGITIMNHGRGRLVFRHGELGLEPLYGHGHADSLSVILFWDNTPVLIDPGSGQYNGSSIVRNYFRSTIAHNTLRIAGRNQAEELGPFLWKKSYRTQFKDCSYENHLICEASHFGYKEQYDIIHSRRIDWYHEAWIDIYDKLEGTQAVKTEGALHLACRSVNINENCVEASFGTFCVKILFNTDMNIKVYHGSADPCLGWKSPLYGKCVPTYSIVYKPNDCLQTEMKLRLSVEQDQQLCQMSPAFTG